MFKHSPIVLLIFAFNVYAEQPQLNWQVGVASDGKVYWPSVGLSAAGNISRYFVLGGAVNSFFSYSSSIARLNTVVDMRRIFIDIDILIMPQIPIMFNSGELIIYLAIYGGPSAVIETDSNSFNNQTSTYWGWNVAAMPGVQYRFENGVGLFIEIGVMDRDWWTGHNTLMGATNLGVSYAF